MKDITAGAKVINIEYEPKPISQKLFVAMQRRLINRKFPYKMNRRKSLQYLRHRNNK